MLVFYSREPEKARKIQAYCAENGLQLLSQSLVQFQSVPFQPDIHDAEVIFFTSPRSFDFFRAQEIIHEYQTIACIGLGTKKHIESLGFQVSFFGFDSTHPAEVAGDFKLWLGARKVLFPVSDISNRSVQKVLGVEQYHEIVVYKTVPKSVELASNPDILIFSSPSNAAAYLEQNAINANQKVACFGTTTQLFLKSRNIAADVLKSPDEFGVLDYLGEMLKKI